MRGLTSRAMKGLLSVALAAAVLLAWAGPVDPGQHLPVLRLKDQQDITKTFALPSLRDLNFEVGVVLDDKTLAGWPRQDDAVTLIRLDNGRVVQHEYVASEAQLRTSLGL